MVQWTVWTPTWCISLIGSPPTTPERERATQVSCIQVIGHKSRPRSIHFFVSVSSFFPAFFPVSLSSFFPVFVPVSSFFPAFFSAQCPFFSCVFPLRAPMSSDSNLGLETVECLSIPRPVHFTPVHPGTIIGSPGCYPGNSLAHTRLQAVCNKQCVTSSV